MSTRPTYIHAIVRLATVLGLTLPAAVAVGCGAHYEPPPLAEPAPGVDARGVALRHDPVAADTTAPGEVPGWRWHATATASVAETRFGRPPDRTLQVTDRRLAFGAGLASPGGWHAEVELPVVQRAASFASGRTEASTSVGDVGLGAGRWWHRGHLALGAHAGLVAPSAPTVRDAGGAAVSDDAQPGGGAWAPWLGGGVRGVAGPVAWRADASAFVPTRSRFDLRTGTSVDVAGGVAWRPGRVVGLDTAVLARVAEADRFEDGRDPDSGGTLVQVAPSLTVRPWHGLAVTVGARIPVFDGLRGHQWVGPRWQLGLSFDG